MRTLFKIVIFLIILAVAGLFALPFFIDPNDHKEKISAMVEKATGRTLTLKGDIELSVFPWVALELGPLSLSNATGFTAENFVSVEATEIRVKLMPLLNKQLEMDTIILDGLVLNLEKDKTGKTNWDDLASSDKADDELNISDEKKEGFALQSINIEGLKLSNASIFWTDDSVSQKYQLTNFNLNADSLVPGEPSAVNMNFDLNSNAPKLSAHMTLDSIVMLDLEKQQYSLSGLKLTTQAEGQDLPFSKADIALDGDINADIAKQLVSINGLKLIIKANKDKQLINATLTSDISSNLATQQSTLKAVNLSAVITDPALPDGQAELKLSTEITADMKNETVTLSQLAIQIQDLLVNGDLKANKILSDTPNVSGNITVNPFNLRQLANRLAIKLPVMADSSTLELVKLTTSFTASSNDFNAQNLEVTLDQTKLTGQLGVSNFAKPAITFKLKLDEIDADRYLPPVSKETESSTAPATASSGDDKLPLEALREINAKGTFDIGKLKISGTHSEKIHIEVNANKGVIKLGPLSANMYQGRYNGNVNLDARGNSLKLSLNEHLKGVQVAPLLKDLNGSDKLAGAVTANAKLSGSGATVEQIKATLSGSGNFTFADGSITGVNIAESIRKAKAAIGGKQITSTAPVKTDFSSLTGSFTATNGLIQNKDLSLKSPLLRIDGAGDINLPKEMIDYGLKVSIVGDTTGQGGKDLADLKGLTIPVNITGSFDNPKPRVDLVSIFKDQASQEVKDKVAEKLQDKLGGEVGGLLGGVLGIEKPDSKPAESNDAVDGEVKTEESPKSAEEQAKEALKSKLKGLF